MEATNTTETKQKRQVKITFTEGHATVKVNGSEDEIEYTLTDIPDEIREELFQYGWKQKVSDYKAGDLLRGEDKLEAITECHEMLLAGEFRQKGEKRQKVSFETQLKSWEKMDDTEKKAVRSVIGNSRCDKLEKAVLAEEETEEEETEEEE